MREWLMRVRRRAVTSQPSAGLQVSMPLPVRSHHRVTSPANGFIDLNHFRKA
jgi:hypothetical protein